MKTAFIFPGQGSQYVGMGKDLYDEYREVREMFDLAEMLLEMPIKKICFEGPENILTQTKFTQPAIFVHSLAIYKLLQKAGILPEAVAGHSLGEYSALVAAAALSFEDGLKLVKMRGELMQDSGEKYPGTMAAIIGLDEEVVAELCVRASKHGVVQPANFNSPGQVVISGTLEGVQHVLQLARERKAKLVKELVVGGAFHSPLMETALAGLTSALGETSFCLPKIAVYSNVSARPFESAEEIRNLLKMQLLSSVMWQRIIENLSEDGMDRFLEVGPSKILCGLNRRIVGGKLCKSIGTVADFNMFIGEN